MFGLLRKKKKERRRFYIHDLRLTSDAKQHLSEDDVRFIVNLHEFGHWGAVSTSQWISNDMTLTLGGHGVVQSVFELKDNVVSVATHLQWMRTEVTLRHWDKVEDDDECYLD